MSYEGRSDRYVMVRVRLLDIRENSLKVDALDDESLRVEFVPLSTIHGVEERAIMRGRVTLGDTFELRVMEWVATKKRLKVI